MNKNKRKSKIHWALFIRLFLDNIREYTVSLFMVIVLIGLRYSIPLVNSLIIDQGIGNKNLSRLIIYVSLMLGIEIAEYLLSVVKSMFDFGFRQKVEKKLKGKAINAFFERISETGNVGEAQILLERDTSAVISIALNSFIGFFKSLFSTIVALVLLVKLQPVIAIPIVIIQFMIAVVRIKANKVEEINGKNARDSYVKWWSITNELVNNIKYIPLLGAGEYFKKKYTNGLDSTYKTLKHNALFSQKIMMTCSIGMAFTSSIMLIIGGYFVISGDITIGLLVSFLQYANGLSESFIDLLSFPSEVKMNECSIERIEQIYLTDNVSTKNIDTNIHKIEIQDYLFKYGNNTVLKNVNYIFEKGNVYYLVGKSGCGKTTLLSVIMGRIVGEKGTVYINGIDVTKHTVNEISKVISYVPQESILFNDTIINNIVLDKSIDMNRVTDVCKTCCILEDIMNLPEGFEAVIDEKGDNFSGGQRSRLCLARALYQDKPILIIDEVTAGVDKQTEEKMRKQLEKWYKDKITIIVTHSENFITPGSKKIALD